MPVRIQGTVLSILLARAISIAPALHGLTKMVLGFGCAGEPGCVEVMPPLLSLVTSRDGDSNGEEKERRYKAMKKSSLRAQNMNNTVYCDPPLAQSCSTLMSSSSTVQTYLIRVVQMQNPAPTRFDLLMALTAGCQGRIHMNVVARQIQTDQPLKHDRPPGKRGGQENKEARCSAAVGDHV